MDGLSVLATITFVVIANLCLLLIPRYRRRETQHPRWSLDCAWPGLPAPWDAEDQLLPHVQQIDGFAFRKVNETEIVFWIDDPGADSYLHRQTNPTVDDASRSRRQLSNAFIFVAGEHNGRIEFRAFLRPTFLHSLAAKMIFGPLTLFFVCSATGLGEPDRLFLPIAFAFLIFVASLSVIVILKSALDSRAPRLAKMATEALRGVTSSSSEGEFRSGEG